MTKDETQRSIRTFYDAVKDYPVTIPGGWQGSDRDYKRIDIAYGPFVSAAIGVRF